MRTFILVCGLTLILATTSGLALAGPIAPDTFRVNVAATGECGGSAGDAVGQPGSIVDATVEFDAVNVVQGWSFGLCHDGANLMLQNAVETSTVMTINGGGAPGFQSLESAPINGPGVTMGVVIDLFGINTIGPANDIEILCVTYEMIGMPAGTPIDTDVCFCDTLGDPAVATVSVVNGASVVPTQVCGTFTIAPPPDYCIDPFSCTGGPDNVSISWSDCTPFDYYLIHRDGVFLAMLDGSMLSYDDTMLAAGTYHYELIGVAFPDPVGTPTIVTAGCDADVVPLTVDTIDPIVGPYTGGTLVTLTGLGFAPPEMDTTVDFDGVTQAMITIVDDNSVTFVTQSTNMLGPVDVTVTNANGTVTLVDGFTYGFIRGDGNSDGLINVADAVFDFSYLFDGGAAPLCFDSADYNDDGGINIADGIYLISFLFRSGPVPPIPYPTAGADGTDTDPLGCL